MISFKATPASQKSSAIGPGMAPEGDDSVHCPGIDGISQPRALPGFDAFFAHRVTLLKMLHKTRILP